MNYTSFSSDIIKNVMFSTDLGEKPQISNFIKFLPVGVELLYEDRRTDIYHAANSRFSQFCVNALQKETTVQVVSLNSLPGHCT